MPEYLAPGVYVEEVSFRSKSIEGVPTSTTGFAGMTRYGPVLYPNGPRTVEPRLITSFTEFESVYADLTVLRAPTNADERLSRRTRLCAFFMNGGTRRHRPCSARAAWCISTTASRRCRSRSAARRDVDRALARRVRAWLPCGSIAPKASYGTPTTAAPSR